MPAIFVARVKVRDPDQMKAYGAAAGPTIAAHGGEILARGSFAGTLIGEELPHNIAVMQFPDVEAVKNWFASPEYQALTDLREAAAEMEFNIYEV